MKKRVFTYLRFFRDVLCMPTIIFMVSMLLRPLLRCFFSSMYKIHWKLFRNSLLFYISSTFVSLQFQYTCGFFHKIYDHSRTNIPLKSNYAQQNWWTFFSHCHSYAISKAHAVFFFFSFSYALFIQSFHIFSSIFFCVFLKWNFSHQKNTFFRSN